MVDSDNIIKVEKKKEEEKKENIIKQIKGNKGRRKRESVVEKIRVCTL